MIPRGPELGVGMVNSSNTPAEVTCPILFPANSVNQASPPPTVAIPSGSENGVGTSNSVITPAAVILATRLASRSVNQRSPEKPQVMR